MGLVEPPWEEGKEERAVARMAVSGRERHVPCACLSDFWKYMLSLFLLWLGRLSCLYALHDSGLS